MSYMILETDWDSPSELLIQQIHGTICDKITQKKNTTLIRKYRNTQAQGNTHTQTQQTSFFNEYGYGEEKHFPLEVKN